MRKFGVASAFITSLILFLATLACARTNETSIPSDGTQHIDFQNIQRSYLLHIPTSYNDQTGVPLVLAFHGGGGNAETQFRTTNFNQIADEHGFIVAYPNGSGRRDDKLLTWNAGGCCGYASENNADDVGFIRALVLELETRYTIDTNRIYATGLSNGGMFSYRLACDAADIFAAIAPVSGTLNYSACKPSQPVSVIHFHGTADRHVPYDGGKGEKSLVDVDFASVKDSIDFWLQEDQCPSTPRSEAFEDIQHETYDGCLNGTAVELYTIVGGEHSWPGGNPGWVGGDAPTQTISASEIIWKFFDDHPKN